MQQVPTWGYEAASVVSKQSGFTLNPAYHTQSEVTSACPFCKTGTDRFILFIEGNYWCRKCGRTGWWRTTTTASEKEAILKEKEAKQRETRYRLSNCNDWKMYHNQVSSHVEEWLEHGLDTTDINRWQLGWSPATTWIETPSLTIPIFFKGLLVDIRHRLIGAVKDKYRSHFSNTPPAFLNGDSVLTNQKLFLVEGEKKAILLEKHGITPTVSYPGVNSQDALIAFLHENGREHQDIVYIPDPNTIDTILLAGKELKAQHRNVFIVELFMKPDDILVKYGSDPLKNAIQRKSRI